MRLETRFFSPLKLKERNMKEMEDKIVGGK